MRTLWRCRGIFFLAPTARKMAGHRGIGLPLYLQQHLVRSGLIGAIILGALIGTVMSPCATPALAAALTMIGSGTALGGSTLWGTVLLLTYGLGHSTLLLIAGAMPLTATTFIQQVTRWNTYLPGRKTFAFVMFLAGVWWLMQGADISVF